MGNGSLRRERFFGAIQELSKIWYENRDIGVALAEITE